MATFAIIQFISVSIGSLLILIVMILTMIAVHKTLKISSNLRKLTHALSLGNDIVTIEKYIQYIESIDIPPFKYCWNMLIAANKLVEINTELGEEYKQKFKVCLLGKGIVL